MSQTQTQTEIILRYNLYQLWDFEASVSSSVKQNNNIYINQISPEKKKQQSVWVCVCVCVCVCVYRIYIEYLYISYMHICKIHDICIICTGYINTSIHMHHIYIYAIMCVYIYVIYVCVSVYIYIYKIYPNQRKREIYFKELAYVTGGWQV